MCQWGYINRSPLLYWPMVHIGPKTFRGCRVSSGMPVSSDNHAKSSQNLLSDFSVLRSFSFLFFGKIFDLHFVTEICEELSTFLNVCKFVRP